MPHTDLEYFDSILQKRLVEIIRERTYTFASKSSLLLAHSSISFLSQHYQQLKKLLFSELVAEYIDQKSKGKQVDDVRINRKLIQERKKEYRKLETETSGLLVNKPGTFIGLTSRGNQPNIRFKPIKTEHSSLTFISICERTHILIQKPQRSES